MSEPVKIPVNRSWRFQLVELVSRFETLDDKRDIDPVDVRRLLGSFDLKQLVAASTGGYERNGTGHVLDAYVEALSEPRASVMRSLTEVIRFRCQHLIDATTPSEEDPC